MKIDGWLFIAVVVALVLISETGASSIYQDQTSSEQNETVLSYRPALNGAELQAVLSDFEKYAEKSMKDWQVPGMAIAIVRGNDIIYMHSFGVRDVNGTDPVTNNTIFNIASITKSFTTALVAMQVDEGKVNWDDKVIDHLPDFRMYDPWVTREFTVTDLAAMRSDLPNSNPAENLGATGYNRSYIMHAIRYIKPDKSFRSGFNYQNNLLLWEAALVESKTGKSWEDNVRDRIFLPLNMTNSSTDVKSFQQAKDVASKHIIILENGTVKALPMNSKYMEDPYGPAGSINSNIIDMAKFLRLQMNNGTFEGKRLINKSSMIYMHSPKTVIPSGAIAKEFPAYYCQGWIYSEYRPYPIVLNAGMDYHRSIIAFMPDAKLGIVVLCNAYPASPDALAWRFFDMYFGNPDRDWSTQDLNKWKEIQKRSSASRPKPPEHPSPALPLEEYAGNYSNEIYGQINLTAKENNLIATTGPIGMQIVLTPWNRDTFSAIIQDIITAPPGFASFHIGPDGTADSVTLDLRYFDNAMFKRV